MGYVQLVDFANKWTDRMFLCPKDLSIPYFQRKRIIRVRLGFVRTDQVCMSVLGIGIHGHLGQAQMLTPSHQAQQLWMFVII